MVEHWHYHLLVKAVAEAQHEEYLRGMDVRLLVGRSYSVVYETHDAHVADAVMLAFHAPYEHRGVGFELLAVRRRNGVGQVHAAHEVSIVLGKERVIILLRRPRGSVVGLFLARTGEKRQGETG